jgi:hypothetical protein
MKTKIVYVLVSSEDDYYYEQLLISLYSLRLYNRDAIVELVVDSETEKTLTGKRSELFNYITVCHSVVPPENYTKVQRSRYLKTKLRELINDDFLYIDTDTIICRSLEDVDFFKGDVCAVLDNHHGEIVDWQVERSPEELNWKYLAGTKHFCGGVIFARENKNAHLFFQSWHGNWEYSASFGCNYDQLGLRKTVLESGISVEELDGIWNCQIARPTGRDYLNNAVIVHYQGASFDLCFPICSEESFLKIKMSGIIPENVAKMIGRGTKAFELYRVILSTSQYDYLGSPMLAVYQDYPKFFLFLLYISYIYRIILTKCSGLKRLLWKRR